MASRRRTVEVFTLSFLDYICCGFGAVILFYTIVSAQAGVQGLTRNDPLRAEVSKLEEEVQKGSRNLVRLHNEIEQVQSEIASDEAHSKTVAATLSTEKTELSTYD